MKREHAGRVVPLAGAILCMLTLAWILPAHAQTCYDTGNCAALAKDSDRITIPTSLRPIDTSTELDTGWTQGSLACGVKNGATPCGPYLSNSVCNGDAACDQTAPQPPPSVQIPKRARDASSLPPLVVTIKADRRHAAPEKTAGLEQLRKLEMAWSGVKSIHAAATIRISVEQPDGWRSGGGGIEYWEDEHGRYRLSVATAEALGLVHDVDLSYDHVKFRIYFHRGSHRDLFDTLPSDPGPMPTIPNPLFLPVRFLSREGGRECAFCQLRLTELHEPLPWSNQYRLTRLAAVGSGEQASHLALQLPDRGTSEVNWLLAFDPTTGLLGRLEGVASDGTVREAIEYADYRPAGELRFPHHIIATMYDAGGHKTFVLDYRIRSLDLNLSIPLEVFSFSPETVAANTTLPLHPFQPPTTTDPCN